MKMIFLDNFLHMDLHPGNVMVVSRPNGRGNDVFTLAFIDAGMVTELSPVDHKHLSGILGAMFRFNGPEAARLMVENQLADGGLQVGAAARSPSGGGGGSRGSTSTAPRALSLSPLDGEPSEEMRAFVGGVNAICDEAKAHPAFMDHMGEYLTRVSTLACNCQIKLNAAFLTVALSMKANSTPTRTPTPIPPTPFPTPTPTRLPRPSNPHPFPFP